MRSFQWMNDDNAAVAVVDDDDEDHNVDGNVCTYICTLVYR